MQRVLKLFDFDHDVDIDAVHINAVPIDNVVDNKINSVRCEVQIHR